MPPTPPAIRFKEAVLAYIKRNIMPGYHTFFVSNGEKAPSGKLRDDAIKAVLEHLWKQLEEDRVEKLAETAREERCW